MIEALKKRDLKYIKIKSKNKKFGTNNLNNNILIIEKFKKNNNLNLSGNNISINSLNYNNNNKFFYKNFIDNLNKKKKIKNNINKKNILFLNQTIEITNNNNKNNNKNLNFSSNLISITESNNNYKNKNNNNNNNDYKIFDLNCLILLKFSKENFENCLNNLKLYYSFQKNKFICKKKYLKL